jgi:hypothetical protein
VGEDDELLRRMEACQARAPVEGSVRMPAFYPKVCVSFRATDLVGSGAGANDVGHLDASKGRGAGAEPWAICDYLRDALGWPMDFLFIDAEQAGMHNVDPYAPADGTALHGTAVFRGGRRVRITRRAHKYFPVHRAGANTAHVSRRRPGTRARPPGSPGRRAAACCQYQVLPAIRPGVNPNPYPSPCNRCGRCGL